MSKFLKIFAISSIVLFTANIGLVRADVIDDNVIKAEKSLANATKRLAAAKECQSHKDTCRQVMQQAAERALKNAQDRLAKLNNVTNQ